LFLAFKVIYIKTEKKYLFLVLTSEEQVADIRVKIHLHVRFASAIWDIFVLYYLALALENAGAFEIGILCVFSAQTQRKILRVNKP